MPKQILTKKEELKRVIPLAGDRQLELSRPLVMGIINVTPDSFSDGGKYLTPENAVSSALTMIRQGADILDIGGESTRPGAEKVECDEEVKRVIPVIEAVRKESNIPISIDTYKSETAKQAINAGADIVNDISALRYSVDMADLIAETKVPLIMMHMLGTPADMQVNPVYNQVNEEIITFFTERIEYAKAKGIDKSKIILDPGIGFGKRLSDNIEILANLSEYKIFGLPLLIGTSRKSFINMLHPSDKPAENRIGGSIASMTVALTDGADIVRVHDIEETVEALKVIQAIRSSR